MKKILLAASLFFASLSFATAQQVPAKVTAKKETKVTKAGDKKEMKTTTVAAKKEDKVTTASTKGLKKDGTPDMRMKVNKVTTKTTVAGPVKKNGTPDMRYKANKKK